MMARAIWKAHVNPNKGSILLQGEAPQSVVVGASMPMSVTAGTKINSFAIFPQKDIEGVVMVCSNWNSGRQYELYAYMLRVFWEGDKFLVDLENEWTPSSEKIGGLAGYDIQLCIQNEWLSTSKHKQKGVRYLPDPNLACRYLAGTATAEEVITAAEKVAEEESAVERLSRLQGEYSSLESRISGYDARVAQLEAEIQTLKQPRRRWWW